MHDVISLFILGFVLSLDNFRLSIALGAFKLGWRRALSISAMFGLLDSFSPLVDLLIGRYFGEEIGSVADTVGPVVLLVHGLYLVVRSLQTGAPEDLDERRAPFGIPLSLSLDNLLAGTGLGMLGFPPVLTAAGFGIITALMTFLGLQLGGHGPIHTPPLRSPQRYRTLDHGDRAGTGILTSQQREPRRRTPSPKS